MLVGSKSSNKNDVSKIDGRIATLKEAYLIENHYLETLV